MHEGTVKWFNDSKGQQNSQLFHRFKVSNN